MKKYRVKVTQEKEYELEINDSKINEEDLKNWESVMHELDEVPDDKFASFACEVCRQRAFDLNFECIGYPLENGKPVLKDDENAEYLNFTKINEDYADYEVEEIDE